MESKLKLLILTFIFFSIFLLGSVSAIGGWSTSIITSGDENKGGGWVTNLPLDTTGTTNINNTYTNITNIYNNITQNLTTIVNDTLWNSTNGNVHPTILGTHVGIGTSLPVGMFEVKDNASTDVIISSGAGNENATLQFREADVLRAMIEYSGLDGIMRIWSKYADGVDNVLISLNVITNQIDMPSGNVNIPNGNLTVGQNIWAPNLCYVNGSNCNITSNALTMLNDTLGDGFTYVNGSIGYINMTSFDLRYMSGGVKSFYFTNHTSDVAGKYNTTFRLVDIHTSENPVITHVATDGETTIVDFLTPPEAEYAVAEGTRSFHLSAKTSSVAKNVQLRGYVYITNLTGGNLQLLRTSTLSTPLTLTQVEYIITSPGTFTVINTSSRILFRITALKEAGGVDPTISLYLEDNTYSRLDVPSPVGVTDISDKLDISTAATTYIPYTGAIKNVNLGEFNLTLNGTIYFPETIPESGVRPLIQVNPVGADAFTLEYQYSFEGTPNNDWLVFKKTDGNDADPDGGIAFVMSNASGYNKTVFTLDGYYTANFTNYNIKTEGNVTATWFKGLYNWIVGPTSNPYLSFNGSQLDFNETKLNNTINNIVLNQSNGTYVPYTGAASNVNLGNYNLSTDGYLSGQPLTGMLGSGIIWANGTNNYAEVVLSCSGLICNYSAFKVRLVNTTNDVKYCDIPTGNITATDNTHNVFYVANDCSIQKTTIQTYIQTPISPGGIADFGNVVFENGEPYNSNGIGLENKRIIKLRKLLLQSTGKHLSIVDGGYSIQTDGGFYFNITSGQYVYLMDIVSTPKKDTTVNYNEVLYHTGAGTWAGSDQTALNVSTCDTGTGVSACSNPTRYRRAFIFMIGYNDTIDETQIHQLLPLDSISYTTLASCLDIASNPLTYTLPTYYQYSAIPLYAYCAKATDTTWNSGQLIDLRATSGGSGGSLTDTSNFVPYTGANQNINLGNNNFQVNGTTFFINASNGNVGIGTSNMTNLLEVESASGQQARITVVAGSRVQSPGLQMGWPGLKNAVIIRAERIGENGSHMSFWTKDDNISLSEKMRITGDGKVGIGTTTPTYIADFVGTSDELNVLRLRNNNVTNGAGAGIRFTHSTNPASNSASEIMSVRTGNGADLIFRTSNDGTVAVSEKMRITRLGNLGIGTTSPASTLDVNGTSIFRENITLTGSKNFTLKTGASIITCDISDTRCMRLGTIYNSSGSSGSYFGLTPATTNQIAGMEFYPSGSGNGAIQFLFALGSPGSSAYERVSLKSDNTGYTMLWQNASTGVGRPITASSPSSYVILQPTTGNVGIGTTTPSYLLTVGNGTETNTSTISIYSYGNISSAGYITRTETYDTSKGSALDKIKNASEYKNLDGTINHSAFGYSAVSYDKQVFDKIVTTKQTQSNCSTEITKEATEESPAETREVCNNIEVDVQTPTYKTIQEEGVSLDKEVALIKQAVYELKNMISHLVNRITGAESRITTLELENQRIKDCAKESKDYETYQGCVNK